MPGHLPRRGFLASIVAAVAAFFGAQLSKTRGAVPSQPTCPKETLHFSDSPSHRTSVYTYDRHGRVLRICERPELDPNDGGRVTHFVYDAERQA